MFEEKVEEKKASMTNCEMFDENIRKTLRRDAEVGG